MTREIKHEDAAARLDALHRTGRIVRGKWNDRNERGEEIACWAGAFAPDVNGIGDACRAKWCPRWFLEMLHHLDDKTSNKRWPEFTARYVRIIRDIPKLTPEGSGRARDRSMIASLRVALPYDTQNVVQPVIDLLKRRIAGEDVFAEMEAAMAAANAAAVCAAWAAAEAAEEARMAAADAAARAARAAAEAARVAAAARTAARAAAEAAAEAAEEVVWVAARAFTTDAAAEEAGAWDLIADATLLAFETELEIA